MPLRPSARQKLASRREADAATGRIVKLEQELAATKEYLQAVIETQEATNEELQSAIERARAFERRDEYERRVGAYDRYLNMLAQVMRMPPEHTEEERTTGSRDRVLPCADLADTPPSSE